MAQGIDPIGQIIQNLFTIQRLGSSINAEGKVILNALFNKVIEDLQRIDPGGPALSKWRNYRTDQFISQVDRRIKAAVPNWQTTVRGELAKAGRQQGKFASTMIASSLGTTVGKGIVRTTPVTQNWIKVILDTNPFGGADGQHVLADWAGGLGHTTRDRIVKQFRIGMTREESIPEMVRRIRGTQAGWLTKPSGLKVRNFVGGVWKATTRDAEAVVRTATTYVTSTAHLETFRENAAALLGVQFSATLDDRTTVICLGLDGTIWAVDSPEIVVPGDTTHVGCRSTLIPVPNYEKYGLTPPPDGYRKARDLSGLTPEDLKKKISTRRGQGLLGKQSNVSSRVTAEQWLRDQPEWLQNRQLGVERARLFREGKIDLKQMVRNDRTLIPLRELKGTSSPVEKVYGFSLKNTDSIKFDSTGMLVGDKGVRVAEVLANHGVTLSPREIAARMSVWGEGAEVRVAKFEAVSESRLEFVAQARHAETGELIGMTRREIDFSLSNVEHSHLVIEEAFRGRGLGKMMLREQAKLYQEMGLRSVSLNAREVGRYAWARYGFKPGQAPILERLLGGSPTASWRRLKESLLFLLDTLPPGEFSTAEVSNIRVLLTASSDPAVIRLLASNPLGKKLLLHGTSWQGYLDLADTETMEYFWAYIGR